MHFVCRGFDNATSETAFRNSQLPQDIVPNFPLTLIIHGFTGSYMGKSVKMIRDGKCV